MYLFTLLTFILSLTQARVVTIDAVTTPDPVTIYESRPIKYVTVQEVNWDVNTIFTANQTVTAIPTGSFNTGPLPSYDNPVTQKSTYTKTTFTNSIDPTTYTRSDPTTRVSASGVSSAVSSSVYYPVNNGSSDSYSVITTDDPSIITSSEYNGVSSDASSAITSDVSSAITTGMSSEITSSPSPSSSPEPSSSTSASSEQPKESQPGSQISQSNNYNGHIFDAISTEEPLNMFKRDQIPVSIAGNVNTDESLQTNKFYTNWLLGNQELAAYAQPYSVFYSTDSTYYGVGVTYNTADDKYYGPDSSADPVEYYINPVGVKSWVFSATEFSSSNLESPYVSGMGPFSANMTLKTQGSYPNQALTIPVAIGMGLVTGIYDGYTPKLFSQIGFSSLVKSDSHNVDGTLQKYTASLNNGLQWNIYVKAPNGFELTASNAFEINGNFAGSGADSIVIQVAVVTGHEVEIDTAAGAFPVSAELSGEASSTAGSTTYRISYDVRGNSKSGSTLLYALPHQVESLTATTRAHLINTLTVNSPTKGYLTGVLSNTLEMVEDVSQSPSWLPNYPGVLSNDVLQLLAKTVNDEISEDIKGQTDSTSTYTAGKSFDKFAYLLLVASEILENEDVSKEALTSIKDALSPWLSNTQPTPFIYDTLCGGITSSGASTTGDVMADFGASLYNDHHFHYGYYIHTAAVIALVDKKYGDGTWVEQNKNWVNSLIRDVANPSSDDQYFPVSRMFDFYSGHSWAHGLFASADGKDEESTSEDYNFAYAMKLWGQVIDDQQMEARGDLMLAIMARSMNMYFYFSNGNSIQPEKILGNRVAGITFENKIDHTTYFGNNLEYIQGIHMIPVTPASINIRQKNFVGQEWGSLLQPIIDSVQSGWAGILRSNQALFDPVSAYSWFASNNFNNIYLDGGASRSWYLAFSALMGGAN